MTIKWVKVDPLVLNGEPFCYGTRLTVRQLLELRRGGYDLTRLLADHPELRRVGVAAAYRYAADHRQSYAAFFEPDGSLAGPGLSDEEASGLPERLRVAGITVARDSALAGLPDAPAVTIPSPPYAVHAGSLPAATAKPHSGTGKHGHKGKGRKG